MVKFIGFKESIFNDPKFNPPARVSRQQSGHKQTLKAVVKQVYDGLKKLLLGFGDLNETYYASKRRELEPVLFPSTCAYVCHFLEKNGVEIQEGVPQNKCGLEGCGYFYGDKVLKCTFGKDEWKIATMLKGDTTLVPVIDTDREPSTGVYLILAWKLDTNLTRQKSYEIDQAREILLEWFNEDVVSSTQPNDTQAINNLLDIDKFQVSNIYRKYIREQNITELADKFFEIVVQLYKKTGYVMGSDLHSGNIGFTKQKEPQLFDLGMSSQFGKKHKYGKNSTGKNNSTFT